MQEEAIVVATFPTGLSRRERVLGYVGLALIGFIGMIADRFDSDRDRRPRSSAVVRVLRGSSR